MTWIATLLGTLLGVQDYKKVKFSGRDISSLAAKGLSTAIIYYIQAALLIISATRFV